MPQAQNAIILEGMDQLKHALHELPNQVFRGVLRKSLRAPLKQILRLAKARCPVETGLLKRSLGVVLRSYPRRHTMFAAIGPRSGFATVMPAPGRTKPKKRNPTNYAHLVEFGVRAHAIGAGSKLVRVGKTAKGTETQTGGNHPGFAARPFLRPAYDAMKTSAIEMMRNTLIDGTTKAFYEHKLSEMEMSDEPEVIE